MTNPNDNQSFTNRGANDPLMIKHQPDSLDDILKDFGLEVSGGDFTKEQFLKAKAALNSYITAKLQEVELRADKNRVAETLADLDIRGLDGTKKRLEWLLNDLNDRQPNIKRDGGINDSQAFK